MLRLLLLASSCAVGRGSRTLLSMSLSSSSSLGDKMIVFIRHGETHMNEELRSRPWGSANFVDAKLWDTTLTEKGRQQACDLNAKLLASDHFYSQEINNIELIVSSPLTRAVGTAQLVFDGVRLPKCKVLLISYIDPLSIVLTIYIR